MTDHIEWACERVGWYYSTTFEMFGVANAYDGAGMAEEVDWKATPDLAEALRVWYQSEPEGAILDDGKVCDMLACEWFVNGPEAFIRAVREVCDD